MRNNYITLLLSLLFLCPLAHSQKRVLSRELEVSSVQEQKLSEYVADFLIVEVDLEQMDKDVSSLKESRLVWNINQSINFDMYIFPEEIRTPSFSAAIVSDNGIEQVEMGKTVTYKGYLSDSKSGSGVRLTIDKDFIHGSIRTKDGEIIIDQLKYMIQDKSIRSNQLVIYNSRDVKDQGGECGTADIAEGNKALQQNMSVLSNSTGCKVIEVALDCDGDYWNDYNDGSFNRMLSD